MGLQQKRHVEQHKLAERSFEAHGKVNYEGREKGSDQENWRVHDDFRGEVGAHMVHFVGLLSEEDGSLPLEHKNGVHQISHEDVGTNEEKATVEFHARSEQLRIVSFVRLIDVNFACETIWMVKAQIIEYHGHNTSENDLLHDFHSTLHRVPLEAKLVSSDQKFHLRADSGFLVLLPIENRRIQFDL